MESIHQYEHHQGGGIPECSHYGYDITWEAAIHIITMLLMALFVQQYNNEGYDKG